MKTTRRRVVLGSAAGLSLAAIGLPNLATAQTTTLKISHQFPGGTLTEGASAALQAGCDMVLICNQPEEAGKVLDALRVKQSKASRRRIKRMRPRGKALTWDKLVDEPEYQRAQALLRDAFA